MKKFVLAFITIVFALGVTLFLYACDTSNGNTAYETLKNGSQAKNEPQEDMQSNSFDHIRPYDVYGILYEDDIRSCLSDYGTLYWDDTQESYVLNPRGEFRKTIISFTVNPLDDTLLEFWDFVTEIIRLVSNEYPSSICVANPVASSYIFISIMGNVCYSAF